MNWRKLIPIPKEEAGLKRYSTQEHNPLLDVADILCCRAEDKEFFSKVVEKRRNRRINLEVLHFRGWEAGVDYKSPLQKLYFFHRELNLVLDPEILDRKDAWKIVDVMV